tara:strand:- start:1522 stop:2109 length:588 start_codon:yes stop_codon:yes gene_type:complete
MDSSSQKGEEKNKITNVKIFPVSFSLIENKGNITITTNNPPNLSKEKIINQAINFHLKGNIPQAIKCYQYCINKGFNDHRVFSNYAGILQGIGKLEAAEISLRKAIEIKPDFAEAHSNLGIILRDLGKLQEAELAIRKAIKLNPNVAELHSNLGDILRDLGKLKEARLCSEKIMSMRSWSILGSYSFNYEIKLIS